MKALFTLACFLLLTTFCIAQAPQAFNYSAVVRNGSGNPIPNQLVKFRLSILRGSITGTSVYAEIHSTTTDGNGMVNLEIGRGTIISGVFTAIPWNNDAFFFQVEVDPTGGNTFQMMGTTQFLSVPYALNAKYAENVAAQFGLFNSYDTIVTFKNNRLIFHSSIPQTIKFFGGGLEDFTFNTLPTPSGITISPISKSFTANQLKNSSQFTVAQSLDVSSSVANGFYTIDNNVTTASNRSTNNNYVVRVLDDCFADSQIPDGLTTSIKVGVGTSIIGPICQYNAFDTSTATIINTNPNDCSFKVKLNRYNIILDCAIQQDTIIVTGSGSFAPITSTTANMNSCIFNGGFGNLYFTSYPFRANGFSIKLNAVMSYTVLNNGFACVPGTYSVNLTTLFFGDAGSPAVSFGW